MSHSRNQLPLGKVLQQAGLVSAEQIEQALEQQRQTKKGLKIGEILATQGRINSETADFFAERWSDLLEEKGKQPIGQYLKQAGLLNEQQIQAILAEQRRTEQKFGELAIAKGWLRQTTLNFFLRYLMPESLVQPKTKATKPENLVDVAKAADVQKQFQNYRVVSGKPLLESPEQLDYSQKVHEGFLDIKRRLLKIEGQDAYSEKVLQQVLLWTGGQSRLTQKLFSLISDNKAVFTPGNEPEQVDYLVQTKALNNWKSNSLGTHLTTIQNRLLQNQQCESRKLLLLYQKILAEPVSVDDSKEQQELLNVGLVVRQQHKLVPANRIYQSVFNSAWVVEALNHQDNDNDSKQVLPQARNATTKVTPQANFEARDSPFKIKNILLLLALIGLLTIFLNKIAKRMTVTLAFQKGNEFLKQKSFTKAVEQYNKLLKIDSNYFQAWTNRGYALAGIQKYEAMRESCSTATIIDPAAVYAWNCQGEALHNLQRYEEAIAAFDKAIALNKADPIFLINKSESLSALNRDEASIESIKKAIQVLKQIEAIKGTKNISGEFAVALTFLGNGYRKEEQYQNAVEAYEQATAYSPEYFPAQIGKGIALNRAKRYSDAQQEFELILKNSQLSKSKKAQAWFHLGKTLCSSAQYASGIAAFDQSLKIKPDYQIAEAAKKQCR